MKNNKSPNSRPRAGLGSAGDDLERKKRLAKKRAADGRVNGLVKICGPIAPEVDAVLRGDVQGALARETKRDPHARILSIDYIKKDLVIETESEKLAQHIADTIAKSRKAEVTRAYVEESACRVLTCRLPERA